MKYPFDLKVGDYCKAYQKGIHRVISIEYPAHGKASTALVTLEAVLDTKLNPRKGKSTCDIAWCVKINKEQYLEQLKNSHQSQINNVLNYLK